jgi:hypothetical protein
MDEPAGSSESTAAEASAAAAEASAAAAESPPASGAAAGAAAASPAASDGRAAAAGPPARSKQTSFSAGTKVRLIGLSARPELNGVLGVVAGPLDGGRYPVRLGDGAGLRVKPTNLRIGTPRGAGGPVPLRMSEEERQRIPLPRNVPKLLEFVEDAGASDGAKLEHAAQRPERSSVCHRP